MQTDYFQQKQFLIQRVAALCNWFAALFVFALYAANSQAEQFHAHEDIEKTAEQFVHKHLEEIQADRFDIRIRPLDQRLRLSQCETPLEAFLPPGARLYGKTTVGVRCTGDKPWKIFVSYWKTRCCY